MKAIITSSSGVRFGHEPEEKHFDTLEQLRDFILSINHSIIMTVAQSTPDELDIEIYDELRE